MSKPFSIENLLEILLYPERREQIPFGVKMGIATPESSTIAAIAAGRTMQRAGFTGYTEVDGVHYKMRSGETYQTTFEDFVERHGASFDMSAIPST